jgi:tetratricopeptide (TPR) repeat protein
VRVARGVLLAALLAAALWPEPSRYHAERELRAATDALRYVLTHPRDFPDPAGALDRIALVAAAAQAALPGDSRPVVLEGSAKLIRGEAQRALELYRRALSLGERAETDLNLARAYERLGREPEARAAFLRAAWVSPVLLRAMLPDVAATAAAEMARLEKDLKEGKLSAPPPLPE